MAPRDWYLHLCKRFSLTMKYEEFTTAWNSALDPKPIQETSLFTKLAKSYRLGLLSNTDPIHVQRLESSYDFYRYFPKAARTYSCSVGASKPNPLIYQHALKACKVKAEEAVYIDDILAYVEAARKLGLTGIQFQSPGQLRIDLMEAGVRVEEVCAT